MSESNCQIVEKKNLSPTRSKSVPSKAVTCPEGLSNIYQKLLHLEKEKPEPKFDRKRHCGPKLNTQQRLFGMSCDAKPTKKLSDTFKSTIFDQTPPKSPAKTPKKQIPIASRNPITGEVKMPTKISAN
uniref:TPX2_importin domain-containing protein n=1 Tax=Strongyloides papillosus TaxID=174720 RepID=A0A0N5BX00_STREA